MPLGNVTSEAAAVKRALNGGGTLLVVGGRSTNFDDQLRQHPRVTFWDSTDPKSDARRDPPDNTKVIICTRFIGHHTFHKLQRYAEKKRILMMPGLGGTGEIKEVIQMALATADPTPPPPPPPTSTIVTTPKMFAEPRADPTPTTPQRRGTLKDFIAQHANFSAPSAPEEARRLRVLADAAGVSSTPASMIQAFYLLRREHSGLPSTVKTTPAKPVVTAPAPVVSHVESALRLIDDVGTGLALLREAVLKVQQDEAQMQATMTALRGFLNGGQ